MTHSPDKVSDPYDLPVFDPTRLNVLMQLEDDDEHYTIKAIVEQFLVDMVEQMDRIENGLVSKDLSLVASAAHTIKGNSATFGLYRVEKLAKRLESVAKGTDNDDPVALSTSLREAFAAGKSALNAHFVAQ